SKEIIVNMDVDRITAIYRFDSNSLSGYTSNGGAWSAANGKATVATAGDAWNIANDAVHNHSIEADVKLKSGNAVGISIRTNNTGTQRYDLILDDVDGTLKLAKRPYVVLASASLNVSLDRTYHLKLVAHGSHLEAHLNGVKVLEKNDSTYSSGKHG